MLVKELITWIVAPLTPAPAAGFAAEALAFSQHTRLITHHPFQSRPHWPATRRTPRNRIPTVTLSYLHAVHGRLVRKHPAGGRWASVLMAAASYSLLDK